MKLGQPSLAKTPACEPFQNCGRRVSLCSRRRLSCTAEARVSTGFRNQLQASLQAAALLWAPAALALQGDSYAEIKAQAAAAKTRITEEAAPAASDAAQQAAETVANQLPDWLSDQPLLLVAIVVAISSFTFIVANSFGRKGKVNAVTAEAAFAALSEKENAFLLDVRRKKEVSTDGSPDIRSTGRRLESVAFSQVDPDGELTPDPNFAANFSRLRSAQPGAIAVLLDTFGTEAPQAARAIDDTDLEAVLTIIGGVDGLNGWKASDLPWREPTRLPNLQGFGGRLSNLAEDFKAQPNLTKAGLAAAGAGVAGLLLFQEAGTVLEVLGVLAGGRFLANRFLFAKDRKQTLDLIQGIRDGKAEMPKDIKEDLQEFQTALRLPGTEEQQKTRSAAGSKSSATSPSTGLKVTATPAAEAQKTSAKPSPTSASPTPSLSQPATEKPSQGTAASAKKRTKPEASSAEARQWIDSWRESSSNGSDKASSNQLGKAKQEVSKEKSKEAANI